MLVVLLILLLAGVVWLIIQLEEVIIKKISPWDEIILAEEIEIEGEDVGVYTLREDE